MIELLAPDQLLGARRGVGVDRIERASVVARGGVRRVLLHANRIETGAARERRARLAARRRCRSSRLRRSSNLRRRLQRLAVHGVRAEHQIKRTNDRHAVIVAQHVGRRQLTTKRTRRKLNKPPDRSEIVGDAIVGVR